MQVLAPNLGQSGMQVRIETWHKKQGDQVAKGDPLFELSNEKLNEEITAPASGTLKIYVQEGEEVEPGTVLADIE
ncbi:MAG: lipoyl domain-containing protein [Spirochaetaceae bacterium]|jgi:pyruvate/2-oxoglutarate dehydrogenase complex dihydrolipoamide acyltransferase (E2) component|nr:lipoyl domain-containing protein [Spirochaetaceae bacterium]